MKKNEDKKLSKYQNLVQDIKDRINSGKFKPGDKLSSENQLVKEFGYSRQTVRQALGVLENEGLIERKRGSGTYISKVREVREKTFNVGVIASYISDYIFPFIINGIESELTPYGYHINLGVTKNKIEEENRILRSFIDRKIDGLIVEGTKSAFPNPNLDLYRKLKEMGVPVVFFNGYYPDLEDSIYVVTDDRKAGFDITSHLINCGCKNIGGMFKSDDMQGHRRYSGYTQALLNGGCSFNDDYVMWYTTADEERFGDQDFDQYIFKRYKDCDGIVCYNDKIASAIITVMTRYGVRVPGGKMIGSFDNSRISEYSYVRITSMNHPKEELGRQAAIKLLNLMEFGKMENSLRMPMEIVVKDSTRYKA